MATGRIVYGAQTPPGLIEIAKSNPFLEGSLHWFGQRGSRAVGTRVAESFATAAVKKTGSLGDWSMGPTNQGHERARVEKK
jgi:hypothetical protein